MIRVVEILNQNKLIRIPNKFALLYLFIIFLFFKSKNKPNIIVKNREIPIFCHIWKRSKGNNSLVFKYIHAIFFQDKWNFIFYCYWPKSKPLLTFFLILKRENPIFHIPFFSFLKTDNSVTNLSIIIKFGM